MKEYYLDIVFIKYKYIHLPNQKTLELIKIVGGVYQTEIPSIGRGNLVDLYIADVEKEDIIKIVGEGVKLAIKKANSAIGSGRHVTVQAACLTTRTKLYLIIMKDIRKEYNAKSMTHVFSSHFNILVTLDPLNLPSNASGWARAVSKTLSQKALELKGGEAIICGRLNNQWKGLKIVKKIIDY